MPVVSYEGKFCKINHFYGQTKMRSTALTMCSLTYESEVRR